MALSARAEKQLKGAVEGYGVRKSDSQTADGAGVPETIRNLTKAIESLRETLVLTGITR